MGNLYQQPPKEDWEWNDLPLALGMGANEVMSGAAGLVRSAADEAGIGFISRGAEDVGQFFRGESDELHGYLSPKGQQLIDQPLFESDDPLAAFMLKGIRSIPSVAAMAVGGAGGIVGLGLASGGLSAGQFADQTYGIMDNISNEDLLAQSPEYAAMLQRGMPENEARRALTSKLINDNAGLLFALGAATGPIGVPGQVAGAFGLKTAARDVVGNILKRGLKGGGVGLSTEAVQSGAEALAFEQAQVAGGFKDEIDYNNVIAAIEEGGALGLTVGSSADIMAGGGHPETVDIPDEGVRIATPPAVQVETTQALGPDSTVAEALAGKPIAAIGGAGVEISTPTPAEAANINAPFPATSPANINVPGGPVGRQPTLPPVNLPEAGPSWPYTEAAPSEGFASKEATTTYNGRTYTRVGDHWVLQETPENVGGLPTTPTPETAPTVTPVAPRGLPAAPVAPQAALDIGPTPTPQVLADRASIVQDLRASEVPDFRILPDAAGQGVNVIATDGAGRVDMARAPNVEVANQLGQMYVERASPTAPTQVAPTEPTGSPQVGATPAAVVPPRAALPINTPFTAPIEEVAAGEPAATAVLPTPPVAARRGRGRRAPALDTTAPAVAVEAAPVAAEPAVAAAVPTPPVAARAPRGRRVLPGVTTKVTTPAEEAGVQAGVEAAQAGLTPEQAGVQVGAQVAAAEEAQPAPRVKQKPGPKKKEVPIGPRPEGPQILPETYPGAKRKAQRIHAAGVRTQLAHEKLANRLERQAEGLFGSRNVSQEIADFEAQNARKAEGIVEEHIKETSTYPTTDAEFDAVIERLQKTTKAVADNEVTVPEHIRGVKQPDALVYLREVEDLVRDAKKKSFVGDYRRKRIIDFLTDEIAARGGDFDPLRRSRRQRTEKVIGTGAKAGDEGPVPKAEMLAADITGKPDESFVPLTRSEIAGGAGLRSRAEQRTVPLLTGKKAQVVGAEAGKTNKPPKLTKVLKKHYEAMLAKKEAAQPVEEAKRGAAETPAEVRETAAEAKKVKTHPILRISKRMGTNQRIRNAQRAFAAGMSIEDIAEKTGFFPDYVREIVARPERKPSLPPKVTAELEPPAPKEEAPKLAAVRKKAKTAAEKRAEAAAERLTQNVVDRIDRLGADETIRDMAKRGMNAKEISQSTGYLQEAVQRVVDRPVEAPDRTTSTKKDLAKEVKEVSQSKTPAQETAENHKMGHVKVHGQPVSITHVKGETRNGGVLKAHYGYLPGTESADGNAIDVYMGPNPEASPVYVIDQVNPDTKAFDEPKVMAGFEDQKQAVDAYQGSFGDGRGADRTGDITPKNPDEFAKWVKKRQTKAAGEVVVDDDEEKPGPRLSRAQRSNLSVDLQGTGLKLSDLDDKSKRTAVYEKLGVAKESFSDVADRVLRYLNRAPTGNDNIFTKFLERVSSTIKDMDVHVLPDNIMDYMQDNKTAGYYDFNNHAIVIRESVMASNTESARTVLHEGSHAAFSRAILANEDIRQMVTLIAKEVRKAIEGGKLPHSVRGDARYAFKNVDEFIAEAFSNPYFQDVLSRIKASPELKGKIARNRGSLLGRRLRTLWDNLKQVVADTFGFERTDLNDTALDAMLQVGSELESDAALGRVGPKTEGDRTLMNRVRAEMEEPGVPWLRDPQDDFGTGFGDEKPLSMDQVRRAISGGDNLQAQDRKPWWLKVQSADNIARRSDTMGFVTSEGNPVRDVADILEKIAVTSERNLNKANGIIKGLYSLEKKYQGTETFEEFAQGLHDETNTGADASKSLDQQPNISAWAKARHPEMARRYAALPADLKAARQEAMDFFREQQNLMTLGTIKNRILKAMGMKDDALAQRIFDGDMTDADRTAVGEDLANDLESTKVLSKITGPYFPLMRRGDHVVTGKYEIAAPRTAATKIADNEYEFKGPNAEQNATNFATHEPSGAVRELKPTIRPIWVDSTTGDQFGTENGKRVKITKNDTNAERRYRVTIENNYLEFFDSARKAQLAAHTLNTGDLKINGVEMRRFEGRQVQSDMLSLGVQRMMKSIVNRQSFKNMSAGQQQEVIKALREQSLRLLGSTRIQSHRIPRRGVLGYSNNLTQNTLDYAVSTAGHLSRLEHQPSLDNAVERMNDAVSGDYSDNRTLSRSAVADEMNRRIAQGNGFSEGNKKYSPIVERMLVASFIKYLGSASTSVVNATQVGMVTMPVLAGRHGPGKSFRALSNAYRDMGAGGILGRGLAATARKFIKPGQEGETFFEGIKKRVNDREGDMLQKLSDVRSIDGEGGLEVGHLNRYRGTETLGAKIRAGGDTALSWAEGVVRELPKAIETINRVATALAAYRLEYAKNGGNHASAVQYAQDMVNSTQFLYSSTNAPPVFNHPLYRLAFQFKKYPLFMYQLLGAQVGKAFRNTNPGDRAEAVKSLAGLAATHLLAAGALGLPLEPIKAFVTAVNIVTGGAMFSWQDVEDEARNIAANVLGPGLGEMVTKGVSRGLPFGLGADLSSRMGLSDMIFFGQPQSNAPADVRNWFIGQLIGPSGKLTEETFTGLQALFRGDIFTGGEETAAENLLPFKAGADALKAYRVATEGKKTTSGRPSLEPYNLGETLLRGFGFTPAGEAERSAMRRSFMEQSSAYRDDRQQFEYDWADASPNERTRMWGRIERWNQGQPLDARLTRQGLEAYRKRRETDIRKGNYQKGLQLNKGTRPLYERLQGVYNQ